MPGFYIRHIAYPQIDNLETSLAVSWNKRVKETIELREDDLCNDGGADCNIDYRIDYASDELISTAWLYDRYEHGAAHGTFWSNVDNILFRAELRELRTSDLFGPDERWFTEFQRLVWNELRKQRWSPPDDANGEAKADLLAASLQPTKWALSANGIRIDFNAYEGGCYACTPREPVELSWAELEQLRSPDSILRELRKERDNR
ncbi:RsiV family protein [Methylosinus sp. LW4]|uniref:RsiV family protein n=1 Tax=Methylosinus sp. LW4 TaxID=136993 RepID=UPI0003624D52|nr:RsiV family protein [Methylosinus sp. LW4]